MPATIRGTEMAIERCPLCSHPHKEGEYLTWDEDGKRVAAAEDVKCECGLVLRFVAPIVSITRSGLLLVPVGYHSDKDIRNESLIEDLTDKEGLRFRDKEKV